MLTPAHGAQAGFVDSDNAVGYQLFHFQQLEFQTVKFGSLLGGLGKNNFFAQK